MAVAAKENLGSRLLSENNYRAFLQAIVREKSSTKKVNFSDLSRKAGFRSRSYLKEVLEGKKSLSLEAVPRVKKAFGLQGNWANYFETMVALEHAEHSSELADSLDEKLAKLRRQLFRQIEKKGEVFSEEQNDTLFMNRYVPQIYASLGSAQRGATLGDIARRSGVEESALKRVLDRFMALKLVELKKDRYVVLNSELDIFSLGKNMNFRRVFSEALLMLAKRAEQSLESREELFMHTAFSVDASQLPQLKEKLKKTLVEFLDENQRDEGSKVAKVTLGFYL